MCTRSQSFHSVGLEFLQNNARHTLQNNARHPAHFLSWYAIAKVHMQWSRLSKGHKTYLSMISDQNVYCMKPLINTSILHIFNSKTGLLPLFHHMVLQCIDFSPYLPPFSSIYLQSLLKNANTLKILPQNHCSWWLWHLESLLSWLIVFCYHQTSLWRRSYWVLMQDHVVKAKQKLKAYLLAPPLQIFVFTAGMPS